MHREICLWAEKIHDPRSPAYRILILVSVTGFPHHHEEEQVALRPHRPLPRLATDACTTSDSQPGTTDVALASAARVHLCTDAGKTREIGHSTPLFGEARGAFRGTAMPPHVVPSSWDRICVLPAQVVEKPCGPGAPKSATMIALDVHYLKLRRFPLKMDLSLAWCLTSPSPRIKMID